MYDTCVSDSKCLNFQREFKKEHDLPTKNRPIVSRFYLKYFKIKGQNYFEESHDHVPEKIFGNNNK